MRQYDLVSVDLGWSKGQCLRRVALSFLDFKNKKIFSTYKHRLSVEEFSSLLKCLKPEGIVLLDIPLKGRVRGFFRPLERAMQKVGLPCRPSKNALIKGRRLLSIIQTLGFKAIEIYPYEFYKFYCLLVERSEPLRGLSERRFIDPAVFRRFFPPYKRRAEEGIKNAKNAEKVIKKLMCLLNLNLTGDWLVRDENFRIQWDIYEAVFGAIAGYLLLKGSPWARFVRDKTGSEILILSDANLKNLLDLYLN